ncbi:hypothetical protein COY95_00820 [Candidatus Woesearchaeota archaeon CG_4_10_14_0_8_um_filter_47_5]|nr:MAG: hypothetical protein COY95_00820 [Candidatus Woesearchaeota archaeon CG_4_10_14_0_8_um_filter_47_5]
MIPGYVIRFVLGALGTGVYFMAIKTGFIKTSVDDPVTNPNVFKPAVILFFCGVGGILPLIFDVMSYAGCFIYGLTIRPTITSLYQGALNGQKPKE